MKTCLWIALLAAITAVSAQPTADILRYLQNPEPQLTLRPKITTADRIRAHGYPAETHKVTTEDGYIITLFRIPYSHKLQNQDAQRPVVLIQHGLFSCSDAWMCVGPDSGIGFNLADAGYDVWFGNARGNTYSRNHTSRSTNHPYFWRFSWHEIGHYDIAAMIDYALATNGQGQKAIHYVGHFCLYDYGPTKNMELYGQLTPPDYPVERITSEVHLWYGDNDTMAAVEDVERLAEKLPNRVMHHMEDPSWAHGDFSLHKEVKKFINDPIIEIMNKFENKL
ncbi:lipase 3-like [Musca domestica]|uniref:Lipase 3-like n=1 Tax=Musca domestica TaxID=7370 RepID=A0ABM3VFH2_MUSDO|nr:lipase 3-like [Musca domestica]